MRFFVGFAAICRCDFFEKKRCDAIAIPGLNTTHFALFLERRCSRVVKAAK